MIWDRTSFLGHIDHGGTMEISRRDPSTVCYVVR